MDESTGRRSGEEAREGGGSVDGGESSWAGCAGGEHWREDGWAVRMDKCGRALAQRMSGRAECRWRRGRMGGFKRAGAQTVARAGGWTGGRVGVREERGRAGGCGEGAWEGVRAKLETRPRTDAPLPINPDAL